MRNTYIILGMGRFGISVATRLIELNKDVVCVDKDGSIVKELSEAIDNIYQADFLDEGALKDIGINPSDICVVAVGDNIETSILVTATLNSLGVKSIYARAVNNLHGRILAKIGAKKIIFPEKDMGINLANSLAGIDIVERISSSGNYVISRIKIPKDFQNKTLKELNLRAKYSINVIGIERGLSININPHPDELLQENDVLMIIGKADFIKKFSKIS